MVLKSRFYAILLATLFITGCSSSIESHVTRFHQLPAPSGETVEVIAMDPTLQQSIEFSTYAQMVGKKLGDVGYRPPEANRSRYVAEIGYTLVPFGDTVVEGRSPVSVGMGVGTGSRRGTSVGMGISTGFGSSQQEPRFIGRLSMNIVDLSTGTRLYEGHVESVQRTQNLAQIMPFLVDALFREFPGESGTSNTVKVTPE